MELTCPLPRAKENATMRKNKTYSQLQIALEDKGFTTHLVPFEICSNGCVEEN